MNPTPLLQTLPGLFNFLRRDDEELRRLLPDLAHTLPWPRPIFLEDESLTPLSGFPVLLSEGMEALRASLRAYVGQEEAAQLAILRREAGDRRAYTAAWERYRALLARAVENATISSYGRHFPTIFWLHHSLDLARLLKETPKRMLRHDLEVGRRHGDQIKYRVFERVMDRVLQATYDLVQRLATATEEAEEALFPRVLTRMRDNVLIFTEDHISRDLAELASYFTGCLRIDGRELRQRLDEVARWHAEQLAADRDLQSAVAHLLGAGQGTPREDLLKRPGYLSFLATRKAWNPSRLLPPPLVQVWEGLLVKLKEFELLHALRRTMLAVERREGQLVCREAAAVRLVAGAAGPAGAGGAAAVEIRLSPATRPLDFMAPWVLDPRVERFGLIYDISEFSQTVSVLHRAGNEQQDDAFRTMFRFQRRIDRLAQSHRMKLEKYLGDGAFYSSREARRLLVAAVHLQRQYRQAVRDGFPFDRGLRLALNHGQYRLIPMGNGDGGSERYEFFGHGLIELSRLVSGKTTREIEEVKIMLINQGYPEQTVHRFFGPLVQGNLDLVDKRAESRPFYAYVDGNGNLVNNGIVATGAFIVQLGRELGALPLERASDGERHYLRFVVDDGGQELAIGIRKLGQARLKGLEKLAVYEIVDGSELATAAPHDQPGEGLAAAVERTAARDAGGPAFRRAAPPDAPAGSELWSEGGEP